MTKTARITYLSHDNARVTADFLIFGVGILCRSSWISPSGQTHPQTVRPRITPYKRMIPITYHPILCPEEASAFWIDPSGQAPTAPGQE